MGIMGIFAGRRAIVATLGWFFVFWMFTFTRGVAQTIYGSIVGTAHDPSGAVIVGAKITVTNVGTGVKTTQVTNGAGAYSFTTLFPGPYAIHAEMQNFKSADLKGIRLQVNQTIRYDLTLELGQVSQNVVVTETLATLNTDTADVGEVIENHQVIDLPLNGREFVQLATLANDVYLSPPNNAGDSAGDQIISEGSRLFSNAYLLDGVDMRIQRGGSYGLSPSIDAIGEFKLLQNTFSAEYGFGQTVLLATIKSGTNQFHGVAFDFMRNDKLDAVQAFDLSGTKNKLRQNQFGGSVGGPIKKDKLFFFLNYEGWRTTNGNVENLLNPTSAQLAGHLGASSTAIDPLTGAPFDYNGVPGDIDPARISPFAKATATLGAFATPSGNIPAGVGYNLSALADETIHNDQGLARIDYDMSAKNRFDGFVSFNNYGDFTPSINLYTGPEDWRKGYPILGAEWVRTFNPTLLNILHFGYSHQQPYEGQSSTASSNIAGLVFGVQSVNPDTFAMAIPGIYVSGYSGTGAPSWQPSSVMDTNTQISDMVMITRGQHILSLGGEFHNIANTDLGWATQNGEFDFNGQYTGTNGAATGDPMADFLLGVPNYAHAAMKGSGDYPIAMQWVTGAAFIQDDWRITPTLTLNLGLRWEMIQNAKEVDEQFDNFDIATQTMLYAGKTMSSRILPSPKANFLPRLGAAWSPSWLPKTVIRGGFSIASGGTRGWEFELQHFQPPYVDEDFLYNSYNPNVQNFPTFILPGANVPTPNGQTPPYLLFPAPITTCCSNVNLLPMALYDLVEKKMPEYLEWNFNIQHELPGAFVLQVGYVGTHGYNLPLRYDANLATTPNTPGNITPAQSRVPYPNEGYVCGLTYDAYSNFDALNVHLERRFSGGKALTVAYSWAKDLEVAQQDEAEVFENNNLGLNYGPYQVAQHLVINYIYELPFGRGKRWLNNSNRAVDGLLGGWQFNGITTWTTGNYLTASSDVNNGMGGRAGNYADAVAGQNPNNGPKTRAEWFNINAFADPPFPRYGTSRAGTILGPHYTDFDLAFFKNIKYYKSDDESKYLQFRWEMFNALNNDNWGNPNTDRTSSTFGMITYANPSRIMQAALKLFF